MIYFDRNSDTHHINGISGFTNILKENQVEITFVNGAVSNEKYFLEKYIHPVKEFKDRWVTSLFRENKHLEDDIHNGKCCLILSFDTEGYLPDCVIDFINDYNFPYENIIFINSAYEKGEDEIYVKTFSLTAFHNWHRYQHSPVNIYNKEAKDKKFIFLNNRNKIHRILGLLQIYQKNIQTEGIISHRRIDLDGTTVDGVFEYLRKTSEIIENFDFTKRCLVNQDRLIQNDNYHHNSTSSLDDKESYPLYAKAEVDVVAETVFCGHKGHKRRFFTEKTFRNFYYFMPFVFLGEYQSMQYLRDKGFETFGFMVDESYDEVEDNNHRILCAIESLTEVCNLSAKQLRNLIVHHKDIFKHNYHQACYISDEENKQQIEQILNYKYDFIY